MYKYLLNAVNVDTDGVAIQGDGASRVIQISATSYGGGSVTLQMKLATDLTWTTLNYGGSPAVFTSDQMLLLNYLPKSAYIRATLTGSTGASAVTVLMGD